MACLVTTQALMLIIDKIFPADHIITDAQDNHLLLAV